MFIHTFNVDISFSVDAITCESSEARNVIFLISVQCAHWIKCARVWVNAVAVYHIGNHETFLCPHSAPAARHPLLAHPTKIDCALSSALNSARKIFRQFFVFASPSLAALCCVYTTCIQPHIHRDSIDRTSASRVWAKPSHHSAVVLICVKCSTIIAILYIGSVCIQ